MTQTTNTIVSFITIFVFCHIISDQNFVGGQAYHFSKGWMPGKRTNVLLQRNPFGGAQTLDTVSQTEGDEDTEDYDQHTRYHLTEDVIPDPSEDEESSNDIKTEEDTNMERLRALLRTLPRIQGLSWRQSSAPFPSFVSHSHSSPQCQIRPHLTRLIGTLLDVSTGVYIFKMMMRVHCYYINS